MRGPAPAARRPMSSSAPATRPQQSSVPAHPPQQQSGGMLSGIGSTIAQGMAFGTGSAIAHRAVGAVAGSFGGGGSSNDAAQTGAPEYAQGAYMPDPNMQQQDMMMGACATDKKLFYECLQMNKGDQQSCQFLYDQLKQCQMNEPQFG